MEKIEQQEAEMLAFLRRAWKEGIDSGDAGEIDFVALKNDAPARLAASKRETGNPGSLYSPRTPGLARYLARCRHAQCGSDRRLRL